MWWKPKATLEVTIIKLGWEGEIWNDPSLVLQTPPKRGVGRIGGVVAFLFLIT
jgi:hypothetical protein